MLVISNWRSIAQLELGLISWVGVGHKMTELKHLILFCPQIHTQNNTYLSFLQTINLNLFFLSSNWLA